MEVEIKQVTRYKLEFFFDEEEIEAVKALVRDGFDSHRWVPGSKMQKFAEKFRLAFKRGLE